MPDRLLIDRKGEHYTVAYITADTFILRVLYPIENSNSTIHDNAELLSGESLYVKYPNQSIHFKINDVYWNLGIESNVKLSELYDTEWIPGANIRIWTPYVENKDYTKGFYGGIAYNILPYSYNSKHIPEFEKYIIKFQSAKDAIVHMMPLKRTDTFLTVPMQLSVSNAELFLSNVEFNKNVDLVDSHSDTFWEDHAITFAFDDAKVIEAGETKELTVRASYAGEPMTDFNEQYIIDCVDGYAPHKRIQFVNGVGTVKVQALGLESGEQMRVKLNNAFYTSLAEIVLDVI